MIKINDIRIGNYLQNNAGHVETVTFITASRIGTLLKDYHPNDLSPIHLTEDWSILLGFSDKDYKAGYTGIDVGNTDFTLAKPNIEVNDVTRKHYTFHCSYGGWPRYMAFEYVHELQNFFYALHQEDLRRNQDRLTRLRNSA